MTTLPVSDQVAVNVYVAGPGLSSQSFGTALLVGTSTRLPPSDRVRFYSSLSAVASDFQTTDNEYTGATAYFAKTDTPPPPLAIARRWTSAVAGSLFCAVLTTAQQVLTLFTAVTNGGFDVKLDGTNKPITGLDFHAQTDLNGVATVIQTALNVAAAGTTCVWTGTRFQITSATTGASSSVGYLAAPTGAGTPVDITASLGGTLALGAYTSPGATAEATADVSLANIADISASWYAVHLTSAASDSDRTAAANWCITNSKIFLHTEQAAAALTSGDTTSISYLRKVAEASTAAIQTNAGATFAVYSSSNAYAALSAWANMAVVVWNNANSTIAMNGVTLAGVTADDLTLTQKTTLVAKYCNAYVKFGSATNYYSMLVDGHCSNGRFLDEVVGLAWFQNALQTDVFNYERTQPKIPQTDAGVANLEGVIKGTCARAVRNGLLAPGTWNGSMLTSTQGDVVKNGDYLEAGYVVLVDSVASQTTADRAARKNPPIQIAAKGAGALQNVTINVTFDR